MKRAGDDEVIDDEEAAAPAGSSAPNMQIFMSTVHQVWSCAFGGSSDHTASGGGCSKHQQVQIPMCTNTRAMKAGEQLVLCIAKTKKEKKQKQGLMWDSKLSKLISKKNPEASSFM